MRHHVTMESAEREALARAALSGYAHGPGANEVARDRALRDLDTSSLVVLVEGVSDQIALVTLAARRGVSLQDRGVLALPSGGATSMAKYLIQLADDPRALGIACLCDAAEAPAIRRAISTAGLAAGGEGNPQGRFIGLFVCVDDLEDELIRAVGVGRATAVIESQGDLRSLEKLMMQPEWRSEQPDRQIRRFIGSGAGRKLRYARLFADEIDLDCLPDPLEALLEAL